MSSSFAGAELAHLHETPLSSQAVYSGEFLQVVCDHVRLPDGGQAKREYVQHPGAVMIIPLVDEKHVVMEQQFRYPVGQVMLEFPAGKLDAQESPLTCAQRELREETGYTAQAWARAGILHPNIGYANEVIEIWFARDLTLGARQLDAGEFLEVQIWPIDELFKKVPTGQITDGKTLVGLMWLQHIQQGLWTLEWTTPCS